MQAWVIISICRDITDIMGKKVVNQVEFFERRIFRDEFTTLYNQLGLWIQPP